MEMVYFEVGMVIFEVCYLVWFVYLVYKGVVLELDLILFVEVGCFGVYSVGDLFGVFSVFNGCSCYWFIIEEEMLCYLILVELF